MSTFRLIVSAVLLFLGVGIVIANWGGSFEAYRNKQRGIDKGYSQIPLLSFIFCVCAGLTYPYEPRWWIFLPTVLDPGTWVSLWIPVVLIREWPFKKSPKD
jgi:hypothetical protein